MNFLYVGVKALFVISRLCLIRNDAGFTLFFLCFFSFSSFISMTHYLLSIKLFLWQLFSEIYFTLFLSIS